MRMLKSEIIGKMSILATLSVGLASCGGASFLGGGKSSDSSNPPPPVATPVPTATPTPAPTPPPTQLPQPLPTPTTSYCQDSKRAVGANVTFLIDNSNSNSATDCQSPVEIGITSGVKNYRCSAQTNREKAVLSAFDVMAEAARLDQRELAVSQVAVVQFPAPDTNGAGSRVMTNGWLRTTATAADRAALESALSFTRTPNGATPYGAAIDAARSLYSGVATDGRSRVAILVTDGEPTDRDPADVSARAAQLRSMGVQVVTVFVTNGQSRSTRQTANAQMLYKWNQQSLSDSQGRTSYYNAQRYNSFETYLADLHGNASKPSLTQSITSATQPQCIDNGASICERYMVEVNDANSLTTTVQQIVKSLAVRCQ